MVLLSMVWPARNRPTKTPFETTREVSLWPSFRRTESSSPAPARTAPFGCELWATTPLASWANTKSDVNFLVFSPGGEILASASDDQTVKLWSVATGELIDTLHTPAPVGTIVSHPTAESSLRQAAMALSDCGIRQRASPWAG